MANDIQVASLTAPIKVKIPFDLIDKLEKKLDDIADTLEYIAVQFKDIDKVATKTFKDTSRGIKIINQDNRKWIAGNEKVNLGLSRVAKTQKKVETGATRTARAIGKWTAKLAQVRVALGLLEFAASKVFQAIALPSALFTGMTFLASKINATTTEMAALSRATGFGMNEMKAMGLVAQELGFTFEHINSLAEEWNNKIAGEKSGFAETNMREGLSALGIQLQEVINLKPEEAFEKIMNAGRDMVKKGKFDEFASAADKIYGQEANRMLTAFAQKMADTDKDFDKFLNHYQRFTFVTEKAQKGAQKFTGIFNAGIAKMRTGLQNFFGEVGSEIGINEESWYDWIASVTSGLGDLRTFMKEKVIEAFYTFTDVVTRSVNWIKDNQAQIKHLGRVAYSALKSMLNIGINLIKAFTPLGSVVGTLGLAIIKLVEGVTSLMSTKLGSWIIALTASWLILKKAIISTKLVMAAISSPAAWIWIGKAAAMIKTVLLPAIAGMKAAFLAASVGLLPFAKFALILGGIGLGVRAVVKEFDTLKALLTQPWWKSAIEIYQGMTYDPTAEGALTEEDRARNKQGRLNREKADKLRSQGYSKEQIRTIMNNDSSTKQYNINNQFAAPESPEAYSQAVNGLGMASIGG
ncbi:MAG: hypothetical protein HRU21_10605 [Pseudomonadales bacterium]|nr:hypothetical protein [Pseudomonadales bacterium]